MTEVASIKEASFTIRATIYKNVFVKECPLTEDPEAVVEKCFTADVNDCEASCAGMQERAQTAKVISSGGLEMEDGLEDVELATTVDDGMSSRGSDVVDDADTISNADMVRQMLADAQNPKPDLFDKVVEKVLHTAEQGADVIAAKSEILQKNIEQGMEFLQAKSDAVDLATTAYMQKGEEFFMERSKSASESLQQNSKKVSGAVQENSKKVSESVQKGLDLAKAKTEVHSLKVSKSVEFAEKRAEAACSAAKDMAESTRGKVEALATTFGKKRLPFRFGA